MPRLVVLWPTCAAHHLHHVHRRELVPHALFWIVHLGALDDHGVGWQIHAPSERRGRNQDLDVPVCVQVLDQLPVCTRQSGVVDRKTVWEQILHFLGLDTHDLCLQDLARGGVLVQELGKRVILHGKVSKRARRFDGLLSRVDENEDLVLAGVLHQLFVADLVHGVETLDRLLVRNADVRLLQWAWAVLVPVVEQALIGIDAQENRNVLVIRKRRREPHEADVFLRGFDLPDGPGHDRLQNWAARIMQQVDLVHDHQAHELRVSPLVAGFPGDDVPFLGCRNDDLRLVDLRLREVDVAAELPDDHAIALQSLLEALDDLLHEGFHGSDVDNLETGEVE
mmetsp:Transcript_12800/g.34382  ORF Transcript_12800/g.34382 Transcript_12800/m.34382 type:complete len:338 (-) Transcript_12800:910-1923(-)